MPKQTEVKRRFAERWVCDAQTLIGFCGQENGFGMQPVVSGAPGPQAGRRWDQPGGGTEGGRERGEISRVLGSGVGNGFLFGETGKSGTWEGWFSRLCFHFFLGLSSKGRPMSFPRSFSPVHTRWTRSYLLLRLILGQERRFNTTGHWDGIIIQFL